MTDWTARARAWLDERDMMWQGRDEMLAAFGAEVAREARIAELEGLATRWEERPNRVNSLTIPRDDLVDWLRRRAAALREGS